MAAIKRDGEIIGWTTTHHQFITFCLTPSNQHFPLPLTWTTRE